MYKYLQKKVNSVNNRSVNKQIKSFVKTADC